MIEANDVLQNFESFDLTKGEREYLKGQSKRIAYLTNLVQGYSDKMGGPLSILDVGPHFLTRCLMDLVTPRPQISTLGYPFPKLVPEAEVKRKVVLNFNELPKDKLGFDAGSFDLITICEVVEHLFTPPDVILNLLKPLLKKDGRLILGTPNAVSISHRMRMMLGENPFHRLNPNWKSGVAHIREYTMAELRDYAREVGLISDFEEYNDYWGHSMHIPNIEALERENPSYRGGITIVFKAGG
jgi:SAM-dependent methyltransferase